MDLDTELAVVVFQGSYGECLEYSLVLASQGIANFFSEDEEHGWKLIVPPDQLMNAQEQIRLYTVENLKHRTVQALPPLQLSAQPFWILAMPISIAFFQSLDGAPPFASQGMNDAALTLGGEWWRIFTALTLHADAQHLAGNMISGYFILSLMASRIKLTAMAPWLFLASGLANFLVAALVQKDFRSLGFSTFVFAGLGALATIEFRLLPRERTIGLFKRAEPLIAALFIATLMGIGENSDILAHFFGLLCGVAFGFLPQRTSILGNKNIWYASDWLTAGLCITAMVTCWKLALGNF
jgi:membrane associated rhomboid family serine protease